MLQDLHIIHRRKPHHFEGVDAPVWATCLRSLAFNPGSEHQAPTDESYRGPEAYRFLLEIVCGLHSPILGETEVFGQFKNFADQWLAREPKWTPLVQRTLADAKAIRSAHLGGLGVQSYGSWVRKHLEAGEVVHVLGSGQLAQEILPYVSKLASKVTVHVRNRKTAKLPDAMELCHKGFDGGALIIAAPISAADVEAWMGEVPATKIFDLRETADSDPIRTQAPRYPLSQIFSEIEQTKKRLAPVIANVKQDISTCSERLATQAIIRPQGWDDLCA